MCTSIVRITSTVRRNAVAVSSKGMRLEQGRVAVTHTGTLEGNCEHEIARTSTRASSHARCSVGQSTVCPDASSFIGRALRLILTP